MYHISYVLSYSTMYIVHIVHRAQNNKLYKPKTYISLFDSTMYIVHIVHRAQNNKLYKPKTYISLFDMTSIYKILISP